MRMVDQTDLASDMEERERASVLARHRHRQRRPLPPVHDGLCAVCCACGGPTTLDRDTCASCADRATQAPDGGA